MHQMIWLSIWAWGFVKRTTWQTMVPSRKISLHLSSLNQAIWLSIRPSSLEIEEHDQMQRSADRYFQIAQICSNLGPKWVNRANLQGLFQVPINVFLSPMYDLTITFLSSTLYQRTERPALSRIRQLHEQLCLYSDSYYQYHCTCNVKSNVIPPFLCVDLSQCQSVSGLRVIVVVSGQVRNKNRLRQSYVGLRGACSELSFFPSLPLVWMWFRSRSHTRSGGRRYSRSRSRGRGRR